LAPSTLTFKYSGDTLTEQDSASYQSLQSQLESCEQTHVLRFWNELDRSQRDQLCRQIEDLDLDQLVTLIAGHDHQPDFAALADSAVSPPGVRADGSGAGWTPDDARRRGEQAIRKGQVGVVIVAGGQGTRLGFPQPKGMFSIGPVSGRTLFQIFADRIVAIGQDAGVRIPLYVMTSDATDTQTRDYFAQHDNLGLTAEDVRIFKQGTVPAVDSESGKLLLSSKSSLALSPDGHGGTVAALDRSGCLSDAQKRGVKHLSYIQVDNPLANLCDPTLIGHHLMANSEMTTQVIRKRSPMERVGNVVSIAGHVQIIEYSDLTRAAAEATDADGQLKLWAGNIGVHVIDVSFLQAASRSARALPFHRASKIVPYVDESGRLIEPAEPNATKFERFIFDLLPQAHNAFLVESLPSEAFAPVKNADSAAADTPSLARAAISDLHRSWLERAGAVVDQGVQVEINPRFSLSPSELAEKISVKLRIESDRYFDG
jgi:UDP-N-acetylglucosamine/UDP-N-acetylgalactosamine diphosphorylase